MTKKDLLWQVFFGHSGFFHKLLDKKRLKIYNKYKKEVYKQRSKTHVHR